MTPEDKVIATQLLEKTDQWIDSLRSPGILEDVNKFCFGTRRDLDFKNGIATQKDIAEILKLGDATSELCHAWTRLVEEAESLRNTLGNILDED